MGALPHATADECSPDCTGSPPPREAAAGATLEAVSESVIARWAVLPTARTRPHSRGGQDCPPRYAALMGASETASRRGPGLRRPQCCATHYKLPSARVILTSPILVVYSFRSWTLRGVQSWPGLFGGAERTRSFSFCRPAGYRPAQVRIREDARGRSAARPVSPTREGL